MYYCGLVAALLWGFKSTAQEKSDEKDAVEKALTAQEYIFNARTALPQRGRSVFLDTDYDLTVSKDSVVAYLPYFGRAYTAPLGSGRDGIQFTSTDFEYSAEKKKNRWNIKIRPKDVPEVQELYLSVSAGGSGTLQVNSMNRQTISFNGDLEPRTEVKQ